ncbi:cytochrome P450 [Actinosynnema sp. NPDC023587]|uniref:cytochrome P450 n=1 Tax=Actinosynnema sp. NPDC023587 TaxID=3154695 RepID=UPI0033FB4F80
MESPQTGAREGDAEASSAGCPVDHSGGAASPAETPKRAAVPATSLPGPRTPALAQVLTYWRRPAEFVDKCHAEYGNRFALRIRIPPKPLYVLSDPEDIKAMFLAPADVLHTGTGSSTIEKFTGQSGLAWLDEDEHKVRRKLLMPSMHGKALRRIEVSVDKTAAQEVASWPRGRVVPLHPLIHRLTLNIIREVIFGPVTPSRWDELLDVLTNMMLFNDRMASAMMIHKMSPFAVKVLRAIRPLGLDRFLKLRERADALIAEAVAERRAHGELGDDMLSVLLGITHEDGSPLTAVELRDEMMTIFLAGTETTAAAIAWAFEYLSRERGTLERLVAEVDAGGDELLTATVHEVLRLKPSIPQIIPRTVMKPVEIGGVRFEPGMLLWASAYLLHRNPVLYPDPYAFKPERFLGVKPGTYTWIPFGGGRIRCLGASIALVEMKAVLREVLSQHTLHRVDLAPERTRSRSVSALPKHGTRLELRARTPQPSMAGD